MQGLASEQAAVSLLARRASILLPSIDDSHLIESTNTSATLTSPLHAAAHAANTVLASVHAAQDPVNGMVRPPGRRTSRPALAPLHVQTTDSCSTSSSDKPQTVSGEETVERKVTPSPSHANHIPGLKLLKKLGGSMHNLLAETETLQHVSAGTLQMACDKLATSRKPVLGSIDSESRPMRRNSFLKSMNTPTVSEGNALDVDVEERDSNGMLSAPLPLPCGDTDPTSTSNNVAPVLNPCEQLPQGVLKKLKKKVATASAGKRKLTSLALATSAVNSFLGGGGNASKKKDAVMTSGEDASSATAHHPENSLRHNLRRRSLDALPSSSSNPASSHSKMSAGAASNNNNMKARGDHHVRPWTTVGGSRQQAGATISSQHSTLVPLLDTPDVLNDGDDQKGTRITDDLDVESDFVTDASDGAQHQIQCNAEGDVGNGQVTTAESHVSNVGVVDDDPPLGHTDLSCADATETLTLDVDEAHAQSCEDHEQCAHVVEEVGHHDSCLLRGQSSLELAILVIDPELASCTASFYHPNELAADASTSSHLIHVRTDVNANADTDANDDADVIMLPSAAMDSTIGHSKAVKAISDELCDDEEETSYDNFDEHLEERGHVRPCEDSVNSNRLTPGVDGSLKSSATQAEIIPDLLHKGGSESHRHSTPQRPSIINITTTFEPSVQFLRPLTSHSNSHVHHTRPRSTNSPNSSSGGASVTHRKRKTSMRRQILTSPARATTSPSARETILPGDSQQLHQRDEQTWHVESPAAFTSSSCAPSESFEKHISELLAQSMEQSAAYHQQQHKDHDSSHPLHTAGGENRSLPMLSIVTLTAPLTTATTSPASSSPSKAVANKHIQHNYDVLLHATHLASPSPSRRTQHQPPQQVDARPPSRQHPHDTSAGSSLSERIRPEENQKHQTHSGSVDRTTKGVIRRHETELLSVHTTTAMATEFATWSRPCSRTSSHDLTHEQSHSRVRTSSSGSAGMASWLSPQHQKNGGGWQGSSQSSSFSRSGSRCSSRASSASCSPTRVRQQMILTADKHRDVCNDASEGKDVRARFDVASKDGLKVSEYLPHPLLREMEEEPGEGSWDEERSPLMMSYDDLQDEKEETARGDSTADQLSWDLHRAKKAPLIPTLCAPQHPRTIHNISSLGLSASTSIGGMSVMTPQLRLTSTSVPEVMLEDDDGGSCVSSNKTEKVINDIGEV